MNDAFSWIRDKSNTKVLELLKRENALTDEALKDAKPIEQEIYDEILGKTKEDDSDVPYLLRGYEYYKVTQANKDYPLYYRKKKGGIGSQELLLDLNAIAKKHDFLHLGNIAISPDNSKLAYSIDTDGSELYAIYLRDLATSQENLEIPATTDGTVYWSHDQRHLYYVNLDETNRPYQVMQHAVSTDVSQDREMFCDHDKRFYVDLSQSKDLRVIFAESASKDTSEAWYLCDEFTGSNFQLIQKRQKGLEYDVYSHKNRFLIITNHGAKNFQIMQTPIQSPQIDHWSHLLPYDPERRVEHLEVFENYLAIFERYRGLKNIRIFDFESKTTHDIAFKDACYTVEPSENEDYDSEVVRFEYESPVTPESVYEYNMRTQKLSILKQSEIPSGLDPSLYELEYFFAPSHDGEKIPVTLLRKKSTQLDGKAPLLLNGYGSYELSKEPYFKRSWFSLVDRGWCVAIAHIRGGGEKGRTWYEQGKFLKKKNTFHDFISVAEHLIAKKYSSKKRISILGGSAGGLLMGAVVNMRPDLWNCVVALVPFVDVLNTMSDETLPLTITEYDEWGNPGDPVYGKYIESYSPYDNIEKKEYPAILATGGLNDPRVGYWEPVKWILKLRENNTGKNPLLLKIELGSGHGGPSGRYEQIRKESFYLSFLIHLTT